jgi:hypothetical protein
VLNKVRIRYNKGSAEVVVEDATSQAAYGVCEDKFYFPEIDNSTDATAIGNGILSKYKDAIKRISAKVLKYSGSLMRTFIVQKTNSYYFKYAQRHDIYDLVDGKVGTDVIVLGWTFDSRKPYYEVTYGLPSQSLSAYLGTNESRISDLEKGFNQGVKTSDTPTFAGLEITGSIDVGTNINLPHIILEDAASQIRCNSSIEFRDLAGTNFQDIEAKNIAVSGTVDAVDIAAHVHDGTAAGAPKVSLSNVLIDASKDMNAKNLSNVGTIGCGAINSTGNLTTTKILTAKSLFSTYVADGLFGASALPCIISTPQSGAILFGYSDAGSGQYAPRIGFDVAASANQVAAKASIGLEPTTGKLSFRGGASNSLHAIFDVSGNLTMNGTVGCGAITSSRIIQGTQIIATKNSTMDAIRVGDDAYIGDGDVANCIVIKGVGDATKGGIVFGSGKDTNLYRSAANTLKTDDSFISGAITSTGDISTSEYSKASKNVMFSAYMSADQTITNSAELLVINTEDFDPNGVFNNTATADPTYTYDFKAPVTGIYMVDVLFSCGKGTNETGFALMLYKNGAVVKRAAAPVKAGSGGEPMTANINCILSLAAGDALQVYAETNYPANYSVKGGTTYNHFSAHLLSKS